MSLIDITEESTFRTKFRKLKNLVKYKEKTLSRLIENANKNMNNRLAIREKHVLNNSNIEDANIHKKFINTELKERYIFEVDKQLEDQTQNRALRTYTKKQILDEFPQYLRTLNDCRALIKNLGYSLKTGWRKLLYDLLNQASLETHDDPEFGESCRLKINKLIIEVNKWSTLEIITILDEIRDGYVTDKEQHDKNSKLGSNAIVLGQVLKNELDPIVPHKYSNWSFDSTKRSFNDGYSEANVGDDAVVSTNIATNSMTLSTFDQSFDTLPTSNIKDTFNDNLLPGMVDEDPNHHTQTKNLAFEHMSLAQIFNHMRAAAVDGNLPLCYSIFKKSFQDPMPNITEKDKEKLKIKGPGKHYPLNLDPFKLLMVAFKNGSYIQYKDAFRIIDLITSYGLKPDISIYNTMMKTCIKGSRWRRCLAFIKDMQKLFELTPNSFTFDILISSCRHSMEDPKVIFEVLRIEKYPREFCYKAALVNAGNHISQQVLRETVHDLDMMNMNDPNKLEHSMSLVTKSLDDINLMTSNNTISTIDMNNTTTNTSVNISIPDEQTVDNELSIDPKKWNKFRKKLLHKLPNTTPAKFVEPGTFDQALEQKLIRSFPATSEYRINTNSNTSHLISLHDDDASVGDRSRVSTSNNNTNNLNQQSWVSDNSPDSHRGHSSNKSESRMLNLHSHSMSQLSKNNNNNDNDNNNNNNDDDDKPMAVLSYSAKSTNKISKVMQRFPTTILEGRNKKATKPRNVHRIDPMQRAYNFDNQNIPGNIHLKQSERNDLNHIYGVKSLIQNAERQDFKPLVSLSSKFVGKLDNDNIDTKSINYAELSHNPYQKRIKSIPML